MRLKLLYLGVGGWVGGGDRLGDRGEECLIAVVNGVVGLQAVQL